MEYEGRNNHEHFLKENCSFGGDFPQKDTIMSVLNSYGYRNEYTGWLVSTILPWSKFDGHEHYDELLALAEIEIRLRTPAFRLELVNTRTKQVPIPISVVKDILADSIKTSVTDSLEKWDESQLFTLRMIEAAERSTPDNPNSVSSFIEKERRLFMMDAFLTETYGSRYYQEYTSFDKRINEAVRYVDNNAELAPSPCDLAFFRFRHAEPFLLDKYNDILAQAPFSTARDANKAIEKLRTCWTRVLKDNVIARIVNAYERWPVRIDLEDETRKILKPTRHRSFVAYQEYMYIQELKTILAELNNESNINKKKNYKYVVAQFLYYVFTGDIIRKGNLKDGISALISDLLRILGYITINDKDKESDYLLLSNSEKKKLVRRFLELNPQTGIYEHILYKD